MSASPLLRSTGKILVFLATTGYLSFFCRQASSMQPPKTTLVSSISLLSEEEENKNPIFVDIAIPEDELLPPPLFLPADDHLISENEQSLQFCLLPSAEHMDVSSELIKIPVYIAFLTIHRHTDSSRHYPALINSVATSAGAHYLFLNRILSDESPEQRYQNHILFDKAIATLALGYAMYEIHEALSSGSGARGVTFLIHGVALTTGLWYCSTINKLHYLTESLIVETSTIFLVLKKTKIGKPGFVISFFLYRWIIWPSMIWQWLISPDREQLPSDQRATMLTYAGLFVALNLYWSVATIQYLKRHR